MILEVFILQTYAKLPLGQEVLEYDLFYINLSLTIWSILF